MRRRRLQRGCWSLLSALGAILSLAVAASGSSAAEPASLEGMWKIETPQVAFRPEGGVVPFTAAGRKRYEKNKRALAEKRIGDFDFATARCASPGLPRLMLTPLRFRIWQREGVILMQFEWNRLLRQIDMGGLVDPQIRVVNGPGHQGNADDLVGRSTPISRGHWEGDTLIVTSAGFADNTLIDNLVPHGYDLKLTEHLRLRGPDVLEDRVRIEDPATFTGAWDTVVTYRRVADEAFAENDCLDSLPANR